MKNVNLIVGMVGGVITVVWTAAVFVGGFVAGIEMADKTHRKEQNLKVVK